MEGTAIRHGLGAFVPADVRLALAEGKVLADRGRGSVLEADVSSFTPLTEALAGEHGPRRGAEEVAALLTLVYGALVAEVDRHGGSVVEFTGDAVSCCFHGDEVGERALRCALAMQSAMSDLRTGAVDFPALKVTIAIGAFRRFSVGDPEIRVLEVLAGPAIDRLAALAPCAGPGEVLVDAEIAHLLGARLGIVGIRECAGAPAALVTSIDGRGPAQVAPPPDLAPGQARPWLPAVVYQRLCEGGEHMLGELRSVVALFANFGGLDYAEADAAERLDAYTCFAQRTIEDYGGTLWNIAVDAKGSSLCAGFGAPLAHDDDPLRAAAAALALREPPDSAGGVEVGGIGLTRGRLYAGIYGGQTRRTFGLQGSKMNLAARLMQGAGPGQILVEEPLALRLGTRNELRPLAPQVVKGRATAVAVHELLGVRPPAPAPPSAPQMVNRHVEREALEAHLRRLRAGTGGAVVIEGEPGIGKSRLIRHLTDRAAAEGFAVHIGTGDPIERGAPYHGWRTVFSGALGIDSPSGDHAASREQVLERLAAVCDLPASAGDRDVAELLSAVLPVEAGDGPAAGGLSGEARGEATRDLLAETLDALSRAVPTLVVLEDVHWLDSASLALALRLALAPGALLLVLSTRPIAESGRDELERLVAVPGCDRIRVGPLQGSEAVELAERALGGGLSVRAATMIRHKAGGNPLFTRELAYALRDGGLLDGGARGRRGLDSDLAMESPDTVETVIASRVDLLPTASQTLLKVGSVLGLSFAQDALLALAGPRALDHRGRLEELELLAPTALPGALAFRHALIRDVVYSQLLYAQRRDLHRGAAEYYEGAGAATSTRASLAHHWELAEEPARAVEHLAAAGEAALRAGAFRECLDAYARALDLTADEPAEPRRAEWMWAAAQACYRLGEIERSRELGAQAIAVLDRPVPAGSQAAVGAAAVREIGRQVIHRVAPRFVPRPVAVAERHDLRLAVEALVIMAEVYYVAADKARSAYVGVRALNLAERLGPCGELAECYGAMCIIAGLVGAPRLAERYGDLSRRISAEIDDPYYIAQTLQQIGMYRSSIGPYASFQAIYAEAIAGFRSLGHRPRLRDTTGMAGIADHLFGRPDIAEQRLNDLLAAVEPQEATLGAAWAELWLGIIALRRGGSEETLERLRRADGLRDSTAVDVISVDVHAISALALWRSGDDVQARHQEALAWDLIRRLGRRPAAHIVLDGYTALAELALARWDEAGSPAQRARAARRAREACRNLRSFARTFAIGAPARWLYDGERDLRRGRRSDALKAWRRALEAATSLDMRHELALAHAALGDHLDAGPQRDGHRAAAAALLVELGAPPATRAVTPRRARAAAPAGGGGQPLPGDLGPGAVTNVSPVPDSASVTGELDDLRELIDWSKAQRSRIGYFAALYTHVGLALEAALARGEFQHPDSLRRLNDVFFGRYRTAYTAHRKGESTSAAWADAFKTAASWRPCIIQHLMLGMNAHINLDLAIAVAEAIPPEELEGFRADFDHMNALLASLVNAISDDIARAWPLLRWINQLFRSADDVIIEFSMNLAREHAWSGALSLSKLAGADRDRAIHALDVEATEIASRVSHPRFPANLVAMVIRSGEIGTVARTIDDLLHP